MIKNDFQGDLELEKQFMQCKCRNREEQSLAIHPTIRSPNPYPASLEPIPAEVG